MDKIKITEEDLKDSDGDISAREMKRKTREKEATSRALRRSITRGIGALAIVATVGFFGWLVFRPGPERPGEEQPIEGRAHLPQGTEVDYQTNPPTSGDHYAQPTPWGVYQEELLDGNVVHALEHGGIWISYKEIDEASVGTLERIGRDNGGSVVVSPRSANDAPIAVASWGRLMKLDTVDEEAIREYIMLNKNKSPEQLAL